MTDITIIQLVEKFTINPARDIKPFFNLTKRFDRDMTGNQQPKSCLLCGDHLNNQWLKSSPWTAVQHCWHCDHLNVIYYQDRMGGAEKDRIDCYCNWSTTKS